MPSGASRWLAHLSDGSRLVVDVDFGRMPELEQRLADGGGFAYVMRGTGQELMVSMRNVTWLERLGD